MAKFINKKEQVYDLKLTSYGHHLLSIGKFKPEFYSFYDNTILYDGKYAGLTEKQNEVSNRIKNETHYIESLVLFEDVETSMKNELLDAGDEDRYFSVDVTPTMISPRKDVFRFTSIIGDAHVDGGNQLSPSWKVVALDGRIMSSSREDTKNNVNIPQVNIHLDYTLQIEEASFLTQFTEDDLRNTLATTEPFSDNKIIRLVSDHLLLYTEEQNTDILNENFEIEVFDIGFNAIPKTCASCKATDKLTRKHFPDDPERIAGGLLTDASQLQKYDSVLGSSVSLSSRKVTTGSVEYYFDIVKDSQIDSEIACKAAEIFNKQTYYIDIDFDCETSQDPSSPLYVDIYGPATEPEICP
tara:strand:- start:308 stop:1372 length:1065 start_codon:yes stop_codon:yes gene_type:complete